MISRLRTPARTREQAQEAVAWTILEPHWQRIVSLCKSRDWAAPVLRLRNIVIDTTWHDTCRHFAGMANDGSKLILAPQLADMPIETIVAILAHEAGHCADLTQPGRFWLRRSAPVPEASMLTRNSNGTLFEVDVEACRRSSKLVRHWQQRSQDEVEQVADALGELLLGSRIGYVGHPGCLVQAVGKGVDRPSGLR